MSKSLEIIKDPQRNLRITDNLGYVLLETVLFRDVFLLQNGKFADTYTTSRFDALNTKERSRRDEKKIEERAFADRYDFKLRKRNSRPPHGRALSRTLASYIFINLSRYRKP